MYQHICTTEIKKARKEHDCDSCYLIREEVYNGSSFMEIITVEEKLFIDIAESENWKILIGTPYTKIVGAYDGDMQVTKSRPEILAIVDKYRLWSED
jgi:hypothetical protein